ncbi:MAG: adenylate kinase [Bacteroidales bacterium]|nr:adenylate kinase [Bacteroidales bacterium]
MKVFDTNVQLVKYQVLKEVIKKADKGELMRAYIDIPKIISPGPKPQLRCCVYKERAILEERVRMAMGGDPENPNSVEVIDIACDECPIGGMYVTPACRGCLQHNCMQACPRDAITIVDHRCSIDKTRCIECGKCTQACPYGAIIAQHRPCVVSCKVKAISMDDDKKAVIDNDKCISCGACVYKCPFGAIVDKSYILDIIDLLNKSENNTKYRTYAIIAPAIVSQCRYGRVSQVVTAIMKLGFHQVVEAALGADITLYREANEFKERGLLTTSCCPSFVMFIEKNFPELTKYISSSVSPMVEAARLIKRGDPTAKTVFIGPCSSKKVEFRLPKTEGLIDCVMSFEELQAFVDARDIDTTKCEDAVLDNASFYGRIFAKSSGIAQGVKDVAAMLGVEGINPVAMNGIDECRANLMKLKMNKSVNNFFEGMACDGGCINGALCLNHGPRNVLDVDKYGHEATEKTIENSVRLMKLGEKNNEQPTLNFVLFGAPGAGKGTHADILANRYHLTHVSTGELLRREVEAGSELGKQVQQLMERGELVDDSIVIALIEKAIRNDEQGLIFDGFPRTVQQADALNTLFQKYGRTLSTVINIDVEREELLRRIHERAQVSNRADDHNEETIAHRLDEYEAKTKPLLDYYQKANLLISVPAAGEIDDTQARIVETLLKRGSATVEEARKNIAELQRQIHETLELQQQQKPVGETAVSGNVK